MSNLKPVQRTGGTIGGTTGGTTGGVVPIVDLDAELLADAGKGYENAGAESFAIPFLLVLQDLSPQTKPKMSGYVQGAKPGDIYNTVSGQLFTQGVKVIPCHYQQRFVEWVPKDKGGGFVAEYPPGHARINEAKRVENKDLLPNGNELHDVRQHYCLLVHADGSSEGVLIQMKSTARKVSRKWNSQIRAATVQVGQRIIEAPPWAYAYTLAVEEEANDQGSWYRWDVKGRERVTDAMLYKKARAFAESVAAGARSADYAHDEANTANAAPAAAGSAVPADLDAELDA